MQINEEKKSRDFRRWTLNSRMKAMVQIHTIKNMDHPLCPFSRLFGCYLIYLCVYLGAPLGSYIGHFLASISPQLMETIIMPFMNILWYSLEVVEVYLVPEIINTCNSIQFFSLKQKYSPTGMQNKPRNCIPT